MRDAKADAAFKILALAKTALLIIAALGLSPIALPRPREEPGQERLAAVLKKAAEYCKRLDKAALDFICLEDVTETSHRYSPDTNNYLYDYQFIRNNEAVKERRILVAVNGKKTKKEDSQLHASTFQYKNVLFGPVGLLSETWQAFHAFKLLGEETVNGLLTVVVEATPRPEMMESHPYGKIWIRPDDGSVLKIAWDQRSVGNYQRMEEWAKENDAEAVITAYSEYGIEKNGLRFPSVNYTEQAFIRKNGRKSTSAEVSIIYRDYKFFTVETEIRY